MSPAAEHSITGSRKYVNDTRDLRISDSSLLDGLLDLLCFLGLLLSSLLLLLDVLEFLGHEGAHDSHLDFVMGKDTAVGSSNSAEAVGHALKITGTARLKTVHLFFDSLGLLLDVLDGKLTTGGLDNLELVTGGSV